MQKVVWLAAWFTLRLNFYTPPLTNLKPHRQIFASHSSKREWWVPEWQSSSHWDLQPVQQRLNLRRMSSLGRVTTFKTLLVQQLQDVLNGSFSNCTLAMPRTNCSGVWLRLWCLGFVRSKSNEYNQAFENGFVRTLRECRLSHNPV